MAGVFTKVYTALVSAGAGINTARRAAEALADHDNRFARIETELLQIKIMLACALALNAVLVIKAFAG